MRRCEKAIGLPHEQGLVLGEHLSHRWARASRYGRSSTRPPRQDAPEVWGRIGAGPRLGGALMRASSRAFHLRAGERVLAGVPESKADAVTRVLG